MRVHHLNCGIMRPPSRRLLNGDGGLFESGVMVCHCLLVETASGLVLVDSGFGTEDVQDPVDAVRELDGLPPEILLVPLAGRTKGHSGVAVDTGEGWLFQVGDAYYFHDELHPTRPRSTPSLRVFELLVQADGAARRHNLSRLRELRAEHGATVDVFSAHDHVELERFEGSY